MPGITVTSQGAFRKSVLRKANERLVLNTIRHNPSLSRADIVRLTGLAPSSVTFIVNRLMRSKLLCEARSEGHSRVGRRPTALRLRPEAMMAVGVEISLTCSRIVLADLNGNIVRKRVVSWHPSHEIFLSKVQAAIRGVMKGVPGKQILGVGVGLPGTIDRTSGRVIAAEDFGWFGVEAGRLLGRGLSASFYYENSAKLSALGERWFCEPGARPLQDFVFVTLHGGLGTGVVIDGKLFHGAHGAASEFGHTMLYPDGRRCLCGNTGCWEEYASDRALCRLYAQRAATGQGETPPDAETILQMARNGHPLALEAVKEMAHYVGLGFANLIMALTPEAIVVGDHLAAGWDLMADAVWGVLRSRVPQYYLTDLRILRSKHNGDTPLLGAVALVLANFFTISDIVSDHDAAKRSSLAT